MTETATAEAPVEAPSREGLAGDSEGNLGFASEAGLMKAMGLKERAPGKSTAETSAKPAEGKAAADVEGAEAEFKFGDKTYYGKTEAEARAKAEHAFKIHRGQSSAESRRASQLAREVESLKKQLAAPAAKVVSPAPPSPSSKAEEAGSEEGNLLGLTDGDWEYVQGLRAKGEHSRADAYLLLKYEEGLKGLRSLSVKAAADAKAEMKAELESLRKPMQEQEQRNETLQKTISAFRDRGELRGEDGEFTYPDMQDDEVLQEVTDMWEKMVNPDPTWGVPALPAEFATTPAGVHVAYAMRFYEVYEPLVRMALAEGYDKEGRRSGQPQPRVAAAASAARMTAPLQLPRGTPRREPVPKSPAQAFKEALVSKNQDDLI